ncbi:hypothetical protein O6P43_023670 [Quillaja saponaria]|uniref:Uncharacterized protein n=1 Tax=Quillaja saponaria TaxID=32244 RepID=A0AAD7LGA5_QUISA|nr:hypothetical protein O6P43_023670 [Quillaja saponaria]
MASYGWIYISKIINKTNSKVTFYNPHGDISGDISAGEEESNNCKGYIPYYSHARKYEITYYNELYKEQKKIEIKDLGGDWLASFYTGGISEDIRDFPPAGGCTSEKLTLTIGPNGYEIYSITRKCRKGGELFG